MVASAAEFLASRFDEVAPMDYYREVFPAGSLEEQGNYEDGMYCGIAITINDDGKAWRTHVTDGLEQLPALIEGEEFTMMAPLAFAGKQASKDNARWLFALEFDLDFIRKDKQDEMRGMVDLLYQTSISEPDPYNRLPRPTYIIASSARNLHIVYLLDKPIAMYKNVVKEVRAYRREFIPKLWSSYITEASKKPQYEISPVQAFRLVGSKSKDGKDKVRCFRTGGKVSVETMNQYVSDSARIKSLTYKGSYTLKQAKELFPDWYERRVEKKMPPNSWQCHRGLYDWWKMRMPEVEVGHRYHYLLCLAAYSVKCGISKEELTKDVMERRREMDRLSPPNNPLTMNDAIKALQSATELARYMRRDTISKLSGLEIEQRPRNYRKRAEHLKLLNITNAGRRSIGEEFATGRPTKKDLVLSYKKEHPAATQRQIAAALGVSPTTVNKWLKQSE